MDNSQSPKATSTLAALLDPKAIALVIALLGSSNAGQMMWQGEAKNEITGQKLIFEQLSMNFARELSGVNETLQRERADKELYLDNGLEWRETALEFQGKFHQCQLEIASRGPG